MWYTLRSILTMMQDHCGIKIEVCENGMAKRRMLLLQHRRMWCPGCYIPSLLVTFHIATREGEVTDPTGNKDHEDRMTSVWRQKPRDQNAFKKARKGDNLMVQFECDWCVFGKLNGCLPDPTNVTDILLMACI
jgi:hypothetical protein